jgi:hypothetical protein
MRALFRRNVAVRVDAAILVLLFLAGAIGSTVYWKRITKNGQPFYYQHYFEPAVMIACGKGFVVARPQVPAMVPFLWRKADRFSCAEIAPDAPFGTNRVVGSDAIMAGFWRAYSSAAPAARPDLWDGRAADRIADVLCPVLSI